MIIATPLDVVPSFLDVEEHEGDLFGRLIYQKYIATVTQLSGVDGDFDIEFYAQAAFESNQNHINAFAKADPAASGEVVYQLVDRSFTKEEAFAILQADLANYWQGSADGVTAQNVVENYFPTVSTQDFLDGFYDQIEALQGNKNVYYVGSALSVETVTFSEAFAREFVYRKFSPVG